MEDAPIESPGSIGIIERYYAQFCSAYNKIRKWLEKNDTTNEEWLRMEVYVMNCTMGTGEIVQM